MPTFDIVVVGGINTDFVLRGPRLPAPGESALFDQYFQGPGGKGANQAVAAARLGARVAIIGCVGRDARGDALLQNLKAENIDTSGVARVKDLTGVALILVDANGEKSIGACMGANHKLTPAHIRQAAQIIQSTKILLAQFEAPDAALLAAAKLARRAGAKVLLDPAPPRELPAGLIQHLDLIRPNAAEAEFLTGIKIKNRAAARRAAQKLIQQGAGAVALQSADGGDLILWPDGETWQPHYQVKSIDATGAGDAFIAGLAVALAEDRNYAEAAQFASATAALKTTKLGAQAGLPTRRELEKFLRAHPSQKSLPASGGCVNL